MTAGNNRSNDKSWFEECLQICHRVTSPFGWVWESWILPQFYLIKCLQLLHSPMSLLYFVFHNTPGFQLFSFSLCFIHFFREPPNFFKIGSIHLRNALKSTNQWWVPRGCYCWRSGWGRPQWYCCDNPSALTGWRPSLSHLAHSRSKDPVPT